MTETRGELIYDGDCRFCTRCVAVFAAWDSEDKVARVPFQAEGLFQRHPDLTREAALEAMQFYDTSGRRWAGSEALREMARVLPLGAPLAFVLGLPGMRWIADKLYRFVARNRYRLGCNSSACSIEPRR